MRPIQRGPSPRPNDYPKYENAKPELVARLGHYCSFCERRVVTQLAVEHIQPKGLPMYAHLIGRWDNFLLACVNCNATKKDKDVVPANALLPDRDNTLAAFQYLPDGVVEPSAAAIKKGLQRVAEATLKLVGLDKAAMNTTDANGRLVAFDRVLQRKEAWEIAKATQTKLQENPTNHALRQITIALALQTGFFSVWIAVFAGDADMLSRLIDAFPGSRGSGCFDSNGGIVSPAPNPDRLADGGKI